MKREKAIRTAVILLLITVFASAVCACHKNNNGNGTADASAVPTEQQGASEAPSVTEPASTPIISSEEPAQSSAPEETAFPVPVESDKPSDPSVTPGPSQSDTPTAVPTEQPTPLPTATPEPDPVTELTWLALDVPVYFDLDFDTRPEKIELKLTNSGNEDSVFTIMVTLGGSGSVLIDSFEADMFYNAAVNNFNTGDNRAEIVVSTGKGVRERTTKLYRINSVSNGFNIYSTEGRIDSINDNSLILRRYADIMGTWECVNSFVLSRDSFSLEKVNRMWTVVPESGRLCTVSNDILIGIYSTGSDNLTAFLTPGEKLYPIATDMESIIDVCLETGENGYITVTVNGNGEFLYSGQPMDNWFSDLDYLN